MNEPAYPIARVVAAKVRAHMAQHVGDAGPELEAVESIVAAGFWASLRREEGYSPKISIACLPPVPPAEPLRFERPLPLSAEALARLAPAVERPGIHLGVWRLDNGELGVWGATRKLPAFCFVLEIVLPGLLVAKHSPAEGAGKFVNIAVVEGDQIKVLDESAAARRESAFLVPALMGIEAPAGSADVFVQLAVSMRAHNHGSTLLVVPGGSEAWRESIVRPVRYAVAPPYSTLAETLRDGESNGRGRRWENSLRRAVDAVAGLTAVDGATVMTTDYAVLAFGAMIGRRKGAPRVHRVLVVEPVEGSVPRLAYASEIGGARHHSAAQFSQDQKDAVAMVASADGQFTVFAWSAEQGMVQASRIEALLI